jgi:hypothetical protein
MIKEAIMWNEAELEKYLGKWRENSFSTSPVNKEAARLKVNALYAAFGYAPPQILWFTSPESGWIYYNLFSRNLAGEPPSAIKLWLENYERRYPQTTSSGSWQAAKVVLGKEPPHFAGKSIQSQAVWNPLRRTKTQILKFLKQRGIPIQNPVYAREIFLKWWTIYTGNWGLMGGVYEREDVAWIEFCREEMDIQDKAEVSKLIEGMLENSGFWWIHEKVCYLVERPAKIQRDELGRLHSDRGPAIQFSDGIKHFALSGVVLPEKVALKPEVLTAREIDSIENVEVKRVLVEKYGLKGYLMDLGAVLMDRVDKPQFITVDSQNEPEVFGIQGGQLYRIDRSGEDDEEDEMVVVLKNSTPEPDGTVKDYLLRVPPDMKTVRQAVAWTFGMEEAEYAPARET